MAKRKRRPVQPANDVLGDEILDDNGSAVDTDDTPARRRMGRNRPAAAKGAVIPTDDGDTAADGDTEGDRAADADDDAEVKAGAVKRTAGRGARKDAVPNGTAAKTTGSASAAGSSGTKGSTTRTRRSTGKGAPAAGPEPRTRAQQRRVEAERNRKGSNASLWYILGGIAVAVAVIAAIVGIALAEKRQGNMAQNQPVEVSGTALLPMPEAGPDPAVGTVAPKLKGKTFTGENVDLTYPAVVMIVAHWCPHCQKEVPQFSPIVREMKGPVKVHLISSGVQAGQTNYPPSKWLEENKWPNPVADDAAQTSTKAFGIGGYPTFISVGADSKVRARASGEIGVERFNQLVKLAGMSEEEAKAAASQTPAPGAPSSPVQVPGQTPGQVPVQVPGQTPGQVPAQTPGQPGPAPAPAAR